MISESRSHSDAPRTKENRPNVYPNNYPHVKRDRGQTCLNCPPRNNASAGQELIRLAINPSAVRLCFPDATSVGPSGASETETRRRTCLDGQTLWNISCRPFIVRRKIVTGRSTLPATVEAHSLAAIVGMIITQKSKRRKKRHPLWVPC